MASPSLGPCYYLGHGGIGFVVWGSGFDPPVCKIYESVHFTSIRVRVRVRVRVMVRVGTTIGVYTNIHTKKKNQIILVVSQTHLFVGGSQPSRGPPIDAS